MTVHLDNETFCERLKNFIEKFIRSRSHLATIDPMRIKSTGEVLGAPLRVLAAA